MQSKLTLGIKLSENDVIIKRIKKNYLFDIIPNIEFNPKYN